MYILKVIQEINNYFFLRKTIKNAIPSKAWTELNLRFDWLSGRIYTIINLPLDFPNLPDLTRKAYVLEDLKTINAYMAHLNLHEIITLEEPVKKDNFNYLVVYSPLWNYFTFSWAFRWFLRSSGIVGILLYLQYKFDIFTHILSGIKILF